MLPPLRLASAVLIAGFAAWPAAAADPAVPALKRRFADVVRPFVKNYCLGCHGAEQPKSRLDLSGDVSVAAVVENFRVWERIAERIEAEEMPPEDAPRQPTADARRAVVEWIADVRDDEARRNAGDPGRVLARRLSNAEFDNTIRDLTGIDIRPTREFPVDPANESGFDNSGESLAMSPALLKKYLAAARHVADHVVLKPHGFVFAPHPAVTDTDRDKYCVHRIIDFYKRQPVDLADYINAAWRYEHRAALGRADAPLADFAAEARISPKYLATVWSALTEGAPAGGPLGEIQAAWRQLPGDVQKEAEARADCEKLRDLVARLRKELSPRVDKLHVEGISDGSQSFVLWKNRRQASLRMSYTGDRDASQARDLERFCRDFPDAFFISDRGPYFDPKQAGQGRLLTAGFHLMQGYFRDDAPLRELVLDDEGQRTLDALWDELNFITLVPIRQYKDFIFFERAEPPRFAQEAAFDFARSEDKDAISASKMKQMAETYLAKARRIGVEGDALDAIEEYFRIMSAEIRRVEAARLAAEPGHLEALAALAQRAYRRPLAPAEREGLRTFYRALREQDELSHEEAIRDSIAAVLLSPHFCYRFDMASEGDGVRPLNDYELASRLSYFLWSSLPDDELLAHAAAGDLHEKPVLIAQARRMLRDNRVRGMALEFCGNWLDFRRFEEHNAVDRDRFETFTNDLRQAMFEEPLQFFVDLAQRDGSVLDLLYGDYTFVNAVLARHYGIEMPGAGPDEWVRVNQAHRYGRGGLLPMAVFLTKNAPGLRTSPVKRGYWVVRRLLGEQIPPPPPEVPELPKDESKADLTLPQLLARHREHKACAGCHQRFDSIGLVFEGFGPIGERRERDLAGRPVETTALFPDGSDGAGLDGVRQYLASRRQADFVDNLCRKLLVYALGRSLVPSDKSTLKTMHARLAADGNRFGSLIESIVTSPQFLNKRGK